MYPVKLFFSYRIAVGFLIFNAALFLSGCEEVYRNKSHANVSVASIKKGRTLAAQYCQSCHALPDPAQLDAKSWEKGVLPMMGPRLGIFRHGFQYYPLNGHHIELETGRPPGKPALTPEQWQHIIDYYTATSPDTLPPQKRTQAVKTNLPLFEPQVPALHYKNAMTAQVKINAANPKAPLIISDAGLKKTFFLNAALQPVDSVGTNGPVVDVELFQNTMLVCNVGVLNPNNGSYGSASYFRAGKNNRWTEDTSTLFKNLRRPVQLSASDFNNDDKTDFLVCEFGYLAGSLSWMENKGNGRYARHVLRALPGAVKAYIQDYNTDGRMDIWVLFAQGNEGVFLYTNLSGGQFKETQVLRFPPVWGSSYFELADFNKDGFLDIVYTCGDNADYSPVLKPYHGVYIFLNNGRNSFTQKFFFPMHGCYKALARDFDGDGDLDLATIAFFADYARRPEEGFMYLENKGSLTFEPYVLDAAKKGRWLTIDAGDVNGDGRTDLVLGNFCIGPTLSNTRHDWRQAPPVLVLTNTGITAP